MAGALCVCLTHASAAQSQAPKLVRALSGPAGTVKGSEFVLDETRNRFVYPQDRTVTVYFEWEHVPGDHVLTATWRQPDGRVALISPDVKMSTASKDLKCYWVLTVAQGNPSGVWTMEVRVNGQPAGSHAFELVGTDTAPSRFTLDQVSKAYGGSVVRVHKADALGRRMDSSSGFILARNVIATSFQSIDSASDVEIEFPDGGRVTVQGALAISRLDDWAVLSADTGTRAPIPVSTEPVPIGSQLAAFNFDAGARLLMAVTVGGIGASGPYGPRLRFGPDVSTAAMGGPLIDESGKVVGIVGGSLTPGIRVGERIQTSSPWLWRLRSGGTSAIPITGLPASLPASPRTLTDLKATGVLTLPVESIPELSLAGTAAEVPKDPSNRIIQDRSEFSIRDGRDVVVYTYWRKVAKLSQGQLSAMIYSVTNEVRGNLTARKVSLSASQETRVVLGWPAANMAAGYYRIDLLWDGAVAWRTYIHIIE